MIWTPEREAALWSHYAAHGPDYALLTDLLSLEFEQVFTRSQVRHRIKKGRPTVTPPSDTVESEPGEPISLDELLAKHAVDTEVWDVDRFTVNQWGDQFQSKAHLVRKPGASLELLKAQLIEDIRADTALRPRISHRKPAAPESELHALELDIFDLHLGKLSWAEEVGENFDTKIAMQCAQDAVRDLLWQAKPYAIEQIILPLGQDYFNTDNLVGTTTAGTRQDVDTRFHLMFRRGRALASWMIHECAKVAPVQVIILPGNHDRQTSFCLGEVMDAEFANDPRVTVDNSAAPRKYAQYGKNGIGFCHGDEEKHTDLPQIMATEQPHLWAATTYREFHTGHLHHQKARAPLMVDDKTGCCVRIIRSLSGSDRWHRGKGYLATRGAEGFIYRKTGGLRAHLFTYPEAQAA